MLQSRYPGLSCRPAILYRLQGDAGWREALPGSSDEAGLAFTNQEIDIRVRFDRASDTVWGYTLDFTAVRPAQVRLTLQA